MGNAMRLRSLDALRGIAAVFVLYYHLTIFFVPQAHLPQLRGYLAVDLFFLLSGFVMAHVYGSAMSQNYRKCWRQFALARLARIYPLFALTLLAMIILAASQVPIWFGTRRALVSFSQRSLILQPFLLQQWARSVNWNAPSWSISTEAEAYVSFIFFARWLIIGRFPKLFVACCLAVVALLSLSNHGSLNLYRGVSALLRTLSEFSLGVLLYRMHLWNRWLRRSEVAVLAILFASLSAVTKQDFLMVGAFACLIYYSVDANDIFARLLNCRPSIALGNWSYSIYLWHFPVFYAAMITFAGLGHPVASLDKWTSRMLLLATVFAVIGLSALSYRFYETKMRRFIVAHANAITQSRRPAGAAMPATS
jgi:peptidoglycan/LPS O-acetylase OafA/YrhL